MFLELSKSVRRELTFLDECIFVHWYWIFPVAELWIWYTVLF